MWASLIDHRRPRSPSAITELEFGLAFDFVARGEANLTRLFQGPILPAVGNRPAPLEDVKRDRALVYRAPKQLQDAADADGKSRPSAAQPGLLKDLRQPDGMADDPDRSSERRLKPPRLNSLSSCATKEFFPLRWAVKSSQEPRIRVFRWEDWR
jgi:hypothetical protein